MYSQAMTKSLTIARVFDLNVQLHPTFALVFVWVFIDWRLVGAENSIADFAFTSVLTLLIFGCVLVHEFGHVFMARHYGVRVHDVSLSALGGVARMEQLPGDPASEVAIALAGPGASLAIAAGTAPLIVLAGVFSGFSSLEHYALTVFQHSPTGLLTTLFYANLLIMMFNLLPAFPMDGGRVLRAGLCMVWGREAATRAAVLVGQVLAFVLLLFSVLVAHSVILGLLAIFIIVVAYAEDRAVRVESALRRMRVGQFALWDMGGISPDQPLANALRGGPRDMAVTRDGTVLGMLWRNRLLAEIGQANPGRTVGEVMEVGVPVVDISASVFEVQRLMTEENRWAVPVTESGLYRGLFTGDRFLHIYRQLSPDPLQWAREFLNRRSSQRLRT